jgi:hypothetical protein
MSHVDGPVPFPPDLAHRLAVCLARILVADWRQFPTLEPQGDSGENSDQPDPPSLPSQGGP